MLSKHWNTIILLLCSVSSPLWGHSKTDVLSFYNGDRVTGEFKSMQGGIAELSTDRLGSLKVEWAHVAHFESSYYYDIRLTDGSRYFGSIVKSNIPGMLNAQTENNIHPIEMLEIVEIRPVEASFLSGLNIRLSAGYSYTKASSVGQASVNTNISHESENGHYVFSGRSTTTTTADDTSNSGKWDASYTAWEDVSPNFRIFYGRLETNDEQGLDIRYTGGAGLGRYFIDSQKMNWTGAMGLQLLTETMSSGDKQDSIEAVISTRFSAWRYDTPELNLDFSFDLYPSLSESGRLRADSDVQLRWELVNDFFWNVTAFGTYDNKAESDNKFDYGLTAGIGWKY